MQFEHLNSMMGDSIVKDFERGKRRYFPITAKRMSQKALREAFFIIYGRKPEDDGELGYALLFQSLDKHIEKFDGKLWVRTIAV